MGKMSDHAIVRQETEILESAVALLETVIGILADKAELATDSGEWPDARFPDADPLADKCDPDPYFHPEDVKTLIRAEQFIKAHKGGPQQ